MTAVAVEDDVIIRLQATRFSSISCEKKRNALDAGRPTPDLSLQSKTAVFQGNSTQTV